MFSLSSFKFIFTYFCTIAVYVAPCLMSFFINCFQSPFVFPVCAGPDNTQPRPEEDRHYRQFASGQETVDWIGQMNSDPDPLGAALICLFWIRISIGKCVSGSSSYELIIKTNKNCADPDSPLSLNKKWLLVSGYFLNLSTTKGNKFEKRKRRM